VRAVALAAVALVLAWTGRAGADEALDPLRVGLRSGVALPFGDAFMASGALGTTIGAMVPVRGELGWRVSRHWTLGGRGELGALVGSGCSERCSGTDVRVGLQIAFDTAPEAAVDAWFGVGAGWEWLAWTRRLGSLEVDLGATGPELVEIQAGIDVRPERHWRVGPMLAASVGRFDAITLDGATTRDFASLVHAWIALGVRGAYDVGSGR
jgi:hypothetical protein